MQQCTIQGPCQGLSEILIQSDENSIIALLSHELDAPTLLLRFKHGNGGPIALTHLGSDSMAMNEFAAWLGREEVRGTILCKLFPCLVLPVDTVTSRAFVRGKGLNPRIVDACMVICPPHVVELISEEMLH